MNRTMQMPAANTRARAARRRPTMLERIAYFCAYLQVILDLPEVKNVARVIFGGGAFLTCICIFGAIRCGTLGAIPGFLISLPLFAIAFFLLRRLGCDD